MEAERIIGGCIFGIPALLLAIYVSFTVRCKGPILSNGWIFLTEEQKKWEDKRPHYKLVSIVFGGLALAFGFISLDIFTGWSWCSIISVVLILTVLAYAIADAVKTEKNKR